jgi:hypothetical protein
VRHDATAPGSSATTRPGWPAPCPARTPPPRAALLIAICAGVILDRMLLGHTELNSPGTENLIPYLHAALDAVAKAAEPQISGS